MIDLNELKKKTLLIKNKRIANGSKINADSLRHCIGEVVEAMDSRDNYRNIRSYINRNQDKLEFWHFDKEREIKQDFAHELADIIICVLNEAESNNIDIEEAILEVIEKNEKRAELKGDKI